ncbi:hypothetical protein BSPWISOXPB_3042, partial [uncultured Gammaproteobacteria bacterium]
QENLQMNFVGYFSRHFGCFMVVLDGCYFIRLVVFWLGYAKVSNKRVASPHYLYSVPNATNTQTVRTLIVSDRLLTTEVMDTNPTTLGPITILLTQSLRSIANPQEGTCVFISKAIRITRRATTSSWDF